MADPAAAAAVASLPDGLLERVFQALEPPDRQAHAQGWRVGSPLTWAVAMWAEGWPACMELALGHLCLLALRLLCTA